MTCGALPEDPDVYIEMRRATYSKPHSPNSCLPSVDQPVHQRHMLPVRDVPVKHCVSVKLTGGYSIGETESSSTNMNARWKDIYPFSKALLSFRPVKIQ